MKAYRAYMRRFNGQQERYICNAVSFSRRELLLRCIAQIMFRLELPFDFVYQMLSVSMPKQDRATLKDEVYDWVWGMKIGAFETKVNSVKNLMKNAEYSFDEIIELFHIDQEDIPCIAYALTLESKEELEAYAYRLGREKLEHIEKKMSLDIIPIHQEGLRNRNKTITKTTCAQKSDGAFDE